MQIPTQEVSLNIAIPLQLVLFASGGVTAGYKSACNANFICYLFK